MDLSEQQIKAIVWKIINNSEKLEVASYLILQARNEHLHWKLRPYTHDKSRDIESNNERGIYYCEAKYRTNETVALETVGRDISIAILNRIDRLCITTNSRFRQNLISYVEKFNHASNLTVKRIFIELIDGDEFQHLIIIENTDTLLKYVHQIDVVGYQGKDASKRINNAITNYSQIATEIVYKLKEWKDKYKYLFICNPSLKSYLNSKNKIDITKFFLIDFSYIYNNEYSQWPNNDLKIIVGSEFVCQLVIKNLFSDKIDYTIDIESNAAILQLCPTKHKRQINAYTTETIEITCKVNEIPQYFKIVIHVDIINYSKSFCLDKSFFDSRFLHIPFFSTEEFKIIQDVTTQSVRFMTGIHISVIKGRGGVGKSIVIDEICNQIRQKWYDRFCIYHFKTSDLLVIAKSILVDFLKIENLIKESDYASIIKMLLLDDNDKKLKQIIDLLFTNGNNELLNLKQVSQLSLLISSVFCKIQKEKNVILVVEDIHLANKASLNFLSDLINDQYRKHTNLHVILAERVDIFPEINRYINAFYKSFNSEIVKEYWLYDLSKQDAKFLIDSYIDIKPQNKEYYLNRIFSIAGGNPLNIVNFLLSLHASSYAYFSNSGRLNINLHILDVISFKTDNIIKERFSFIMKQNSTYRDILFLLILFSNRLPKQILSHIFIKSYVNCLNELQRNRFIYIETLFIRFDHETLYNYLRDNIISYFSKDDLETTVLRIYQTLKCKCKHILKREVLLNILFFCPKRYDSLFIKECSQYIHQLIDVEDKRNAIRYCDFFLSKFSQETQIDKLLECLSIKVTRCCIEKEYSNIDYVIDQSLDLEHELFYFQDTGNFHNKIKKIRIELYAHLGSAFQQISNPYKSIEYLNKQLSLLDSQDSSICIVYNRLGVSYKMISDMDKALKYLSESLHMAYKLNNQYLIYHNYYDISELFLEFGNINAARKYMNKAVNVDYTEFGNRKQVGYLDGHKMILFHQILFDNIFNMGELDALIQKAYDGNFTWHYCSIANLKGIINIKLHKFESAISIYKDILSYCELYSNSTKQKIYILNNLIVSYYFFGGIEKNTSYIQELICNIRKDIYGSSGVVVRKRNIMAIKNLLRIGFNHQEFSDLVKFNTELGYIEDTYYKMHFVDKEVYLIYH